jgi:hypothetical protein
MCLLLGGISYSQTAGFMGKHLHIGYGFNTSPALINSTANQETIFGNGGTAESGSLAFNAMHEVYLDYLLSSKWTIGISAKFYKTNYDNALMFQNPFDIYYNGSRNNGSEHIKGYYAIKGQSYTLCVKLFGNRYVAPWGRYVMFGPVINTYKTSYDPAIMNSTVNYYDSYNYYSTDTLITDFGPREKSYVKFGLMVGWGRSRIIANRICIDYGVTIQPIAFASMFFRATDFSEIFGGNNVSNINYIDITSKRRLQGMNAFNVFLKVGFIL